MSSERGGEIAMKHRSSRGTSFMVTASDECQLIQMRLKTYSLQWRKVAQIRIIQNKIKQVPVLCFSVYISEGYIKLFPPLLKLRPVAREQKQLLLYTVRVL